ncbi:cellulose binding domain-containing protein [Clostridium sp. HBUAS56017]|uniref:cellulose binding domain-containing protein n=1 Tax=Clostridium sp. HBUAS56017 TaxID=2571128 RepID=UPI00163D96F7|nr:cellulose binding domain-containing protein [Clostridium sp. HBUAS56017]
MNLKRKTKSFLALSVILVCSLVLCGNGQKASASSTREIKYGAFFADQPTTQGIKDFENLQQKHLDVVNMFINWKTNFSDIKANFDAVYGNNSKMSLTWEAWGMSNLDIANGLKDEYIRQMAQDIKTYNKDIIIRLFHESNGNWYDWALGDSKVNTNETFIAAFRHVVDIFREVGASNVKWDFNVNASSVGKGASYLGNYPGDDYVDIISMDGYNWGTTQSWGSTWQSFDEIFSQAYNAVKVKNKPISISEFAATEIGGDKAEWYTDAFNSINSDKYSLINTIVTFSIDKETDWRINSSEAALKAYIAGIHMSDSVKPSQPEQSGNLKVQEFNNSLSGTANTLSPRLKVINTGNTDINLSDVKIRYYYTSDNEKEQKFTCDWSSIGANNVIGTFVKMPEAKSGADNYLEISFGNGAGSLGAGQSIEIQSRINKTDWTNYTQVGDYSFNSTASTYGDWNKVTAYLSDNLNWGMEP